MKGAHVGGEGKIAEVDGGYFGGYVKPANHAENRVDRRLAMNQNGKRKVVVVIRERDGRTLTQVFASEAASTAFIKARVAKGTELMADEAGSWNALHAVVPDEADQPSRGLQRSTALARMARKNFSAACAARRSAIITISPASISAATPPRPAGATTIAA